MAGLKILKFHGFLITLCYFSTVFKYSRSSQLYEVKAALPYSDTFINCSILPADTQVTWEYRNTILNTTNSDKYMKNSSGLIVYNVTDDDEGQYICLSQPFTLLQAYIQLNVKCKKLKIWLQHTYNV